MNGYFKVTVFFFKIRCHDIKLSKLSCYFILFTNIYIILASLLMNIFGYCLWIYFHEYLKIAKSWKHFSAESKVDENISKFADKTGLQRWQIIAALIGNILQIWIFLLVAWLGPIRYICAFFCVLWRATLNCLFGIWEHS